MSHRAVRAVQAHVRHVLVAAKIKKSKGLFCKCHTMVPQKGGGGEQSVTSNAKHGLLRHNGVV